MNELVKITHTEDGDKIHKPYWCLSVFHAGSLMTFCDNQVFGLGEGIAKYKTKQKEVGGITCPNCLRRIKEIKAVKL